MTDPPTGGENRGDPITDSELRFPVVGIGASAGGLSALRTFFEAMPADSGMAFAVVQHMQPQHESLLSELLQNHTDMAVIEVDSQGVLVEPNHIYVVAPNHNIALFNRRMHLMELTEDHSHHLTIDYLFRSLAEDQGRNAIGIVLSGTGSDGTVGARAIKAHNGIVMVQAPDEAEFAGMPESAIRTGLVDYVLPVEEMPRQLISYVQHRSGLINRPRATSLTAEADQLQKVLLLLRQRTGHDFSQYKESMLLRRLDQRLVVNQLSSLSDYAQLLQHDRDEADKLFRELLIGVSSFFRDPEAFAALAEKAIPELFRQRRGGDAEIRVWVPGCATGEEAYSIAILLHEERIRRGVDIPIQIFATDLDKDAVDFARRGIYPIGIAADMSDERFETYFRRIDDGHYLIRSVLRDMVIFAEQSIIQDPPFARLDLISCRNVLIYFNTQMQHQVLTLFHYALNPRGYLFTGTSESLGSLDFLYQPIDLHAKLYRRAGGGSRPPLPVPFMSPAEGQVTYTRKVRRTQRLRIQERANEIARDHFVPAYLVATRMGNILLVHGDVGQYLTFPSGPVEMTISAMARKGLRAPLAMAVRRAVEEGEQVRLDQVRFRDGDQYITLSLIAIPLGEDDEDEGATVFFQKAEEQTTASVSSAPELSEAEKLQIATLEQELLAMRQYIQTTTEDMEAAYEELQSYNEELLSTNEELVTSKEELQSIHEESLQKHDELEDKVRALTTANNHLNNLLRSIDFGILFLDIDLKITFLNQRVQDFVNVTARDIGRPLAHFTTKIAGLDLVEEANAVLDTLNVTRREVKLPDGRWVQIHVRPYRTVQNAIDGVVVTFINIPEPAYNEPG